MYSDDDDDKKYTDLLHNEMQFFKENFELENNSNIIEIYDKFHSNNSHCPCLATIAKSAKKTISID